MHSCTWAHDIRLHIAGTNDQRVLNKHSKELPQSHCGDNREGTLFS